MATAPTSCYVFGSFRLDPIRRLLTRGGAPVALRPKAFDLLLALAQRPGQDVEKDELLTLVWPDAVVEENNLPHTISRLRKVLDERLDDHRYIVTVPGRGYRFVAPVTVVADADERHAARSSDRGHSGAAHAARLIVLPFTLLRPDPEIEFLTFSLADAITVSLSGLESLVVRSSATAAQFAGGMTDPRAIATRAAVDVVLTGTLLRADEQVRLNVQLVEVPSGTIVWSQAMQAPLGDVLHVHDVLVRRIVASLAVPLSGRDRDVLKRDRSSRTAAPDVYASYLKGRYHWNRRTPDALRRAIACFEAAIDRNPRYAPAHAGLADCYMLGGSSGLSRHDSMARAKAAATTALTLDDDLAEAHASLAAVAFRWEWDWAGAETEFTRAIHLNPGAASVRHGYALFLTVQGRISEALAEMTYAADLDPLSLVVAAGRGRVLDFAGRYDDAVEQYRRTLEIDAGFAEAHFDLAMAYLHTGRYDAALASARQAVALAPESLVYAEYVAYTRARMGHLDDAASFLDVLAARGETTYVSPFLRAHLLLTLDRRDEAIAQLEAAFDARAGELVYLGVDPDCRSLRGDQRFRQLLRRIGLPADAV
jgi:DNA-binding winged helix-turn-helix (wHTH) protein/tetratricopeptide (TPR) repeat protein